MRNSILTVLILLFKSVQGDIESKMKSSDKTLGSAFDCSRRFDQEAQEVIQASFRRHTLKILVGWMETT